MIVRLEIVTSLQPVLNVTQDDFPMTFEEGAVPNRTVGSQPERISATGTSTTFKSERYLTSRMVTGDR
jgi:hypothetical protein